MYFLMSISCFSFVKKVPYIESLLWVFLLLIIAWSVLTDFPEVGTLIQSLSKETQRHVLAGMKIHA